ncbi:transketolase [Desulfohalovibrio reitneri]|uniref:transketolase n=1 Tax=Desulfohalovibrio reitneri TaxID=1307759 RepID=UPI0004A6E107|nr:transketolase [Desulfohalovibrio reitneri]
MPDIARLQGMARLLRYWILTATTQAGSGHPTSSLSAVELMAGLLWGEKGGRRFFRFDPEERDHPANDRLIFSKGHASPLFYSLWAGAGQVDEDELMTYRHFGSRMEGHPTSSFPFTEAATGSLGQGLAVGLGMALDAKRVDGLPANVFVLLGDSEMAEGSQWEAMQLAAHYGLDNLVGVLDVNRLGQRGETMHGHDLAVYERKVGAFGWEAVVVEDGHDLEQVADAYARALEADRPAMLIARTVKGKGVAEAEDKNGWHGKALDQEACDRAVADLGEVDRDLRLELAPPEYRRPNRRSPGGIEPPEYGMGDKVPTRKAYGNALKRIFPAHPEMVVLDGEVSNSTKAAAFKEAHPERFFEMFIAEQAMAGAALGFAAKGKRPFASTFAAFWSRASDFIRMAQYSEPSMVFCGSHAGVSIGEDGPSQMGLEDMAFFRTLLGSAVLYPSDAMSCERLVEEAAGFEGMAYIRTTRGGTPVIYGPEETFPIGGCKVLRRTAADKAALVAAGVTLHEALDAAAELAEEGISVRVIDLYSVKPVDRDTLLETAGEVGAIITIEDHYAAGGLGEAVLSALAGHPCPVHSLAVTKKARSGPSREQLEHQGLSKDAIIRKVKEVA